MSILLLIPYHHNLFRTNHSRSIVCGGIRAPIPHLGIFLKFDAQNSIFSPLRKSNQVKLLPIWRAPSSVLISSGLYDSFTSEFASYQPLHRTAHIAIVLKLKIKFANLTNSYIIFYKEFYETSILQLSTNSDKLFC